MERKLLECVPNFSEGRDMEIIGQIAGAISAAGDVRLLGVEPGADANRTVMTFTGAPEAVVEAAYRGAAKAAELIDMRLHHGAHPRIGAVDVLPLVPVSGVSLEECARLARELAGRMCSSLGIPCYCYEAAAFRPERRNLAVCRAGEYESLREKMAGPTGRPDFCPEGWNEAVARTGASCVGARNFLIAVNFNLDTKDAALAHEIACDVREKGRKAPDGSSLIRGTLPGCKAIGWFMEDYGFAQVSMNITDIARAPLHLVFEEVSRAAAARGVRVTGTELIGLVPEHVLTAAGRYFLEKQGPASDAIPKGAPGADTDADRLVTAAVRAMGLDQLRPFDPARKVFR